MKNKSVESSKYMLKTCRGTDAKQIVIDFKFQT